MKQKSTNELQEEILSLVERPYDVILDSYQRREKGLGKIERRLRLVPKVTLGIMISGALAFLWSGKMLYDIRSKNAHSMTVMAREQLNTRDYWCVTEGNGSNIIKYLDRRPFGSLDEVTFIEDGKLTTLHPGERDFDSYADRYNSQPNPFAK